MNTAAATAEAAGPFRDYGPDGAAGGLSRSTLLQADDTITRTFFRERAADASVGCTGLGAKI